MMAHENTILLPQDSKTFDLPFNQHIGVKDTDKVVYYVFVKTVTQDLRRLHCSCQFFTMYQLGCSHIFTVLNSYQVRQAHQIEPFERWTKRHQWENYMHEDLSLMPASRLEQKALRAAEKKHIYEVVAVESTDLTVQQI